MPLRQPPGEAQVDFGHALACIGGVLTKVWTVPILHASVRLLGREILRPRPGVGKKRKCHRINEDGVFGSDTTRPRSATPHETLATSYFPIRTCEIPDSWYIGAIGGWGVGNHRQGPSSLPEQGPPPSDREALREKYYAA